MTHLLPWLAAESPRRLAPALTRFVSCSTPWSAQNITHALTDAAHRGGHRSPLVDQPVHTRPAVLLARMLRDLDESADYPGPAFTTDPTPTAVCQLTDCDGWITILDQHGAPLAARPCPDREHRRVHHDQDEVADAENNPF